MNLADVVGARRSVRSFTQDPVDQASVRRAVSLAAQAPAPHHSSPWRFVMVEGEASKASLSDAMAAAWQVDLERDGHPPERVTSVLARSRAMLLATPLLVICCADMAHAHMYDDDRRIRAEWTLFAHSVGAALQTFMLSLAEDGLASCWISAPVFCGDVVRRQLGLGPTVEPHALVLVGNAAPDYRPRPRPAPDPGAFIIEPAPSP
ncbi:MAG TPA: nitroreductase family protein [Actinomycetota bacterium]|nr:nitroreductase family protein [Actinomycetota bacterium]